MSPVTPSRNSRPVWSGPRSYRYGTIDTSSPGSMMQRGGDALFQGPLGRVLALGLRQDDGQSVPTHERSNGAEMLLGYAKSGEQGRRFLDVGDRRRSLRSHLPLEHALGLVPVRGQEVVIFLDVQGAVASPAISNSQPRP